ncbi:PorT family protein [Balneolaceae bacterium YR4-1]|uniref:PorT family protein n=1 Tax=Halalkalibaculum roseum TaxID=2709311 RepID=A0A6M1SUT6_9BACT|nr:porin family protein [Halalkalibaculum roseum]NGP76700.1 PorT family protein [Halalkalibaculum roseum]
MSKKINGKVILLSCIFILSILNTQIKTAYAQDIGIGLKTGLDFSTLLNNFHFQSGDLNLDLSPNITTGYNIGLIYRNRIHSNFRLQAEPSFLEIGAQFDEAFTLRGFEFQTKSETKLSYLHLPIVLELTTTPPDLQEFPKPWEETTYHATIGFYGSYLLEANFSGTNTGTPLGVDFEESFSNDITSQFNEVDTGIIFGGGLEYGYQNKIGIETRLMLGLINSNNSANTEFKPNNLSVSVAIYYLF